VASDRAQGRSRPASPGRSRTPATHPVATTAGRWPRGDQREQQEPLRGAVGDFRQARFFGLGAFQQAHDGRQACVLAQGRTSTVSAPSTLRVPPVTRSPAARLRQVFAGQQRFVDAGRPSRMRRRRGSPRRAAPARGRPLQFAEQDAFALAVGVQAQARGRQQVDQLRGGRGRAFAGAAFQVAPGSRNRANMPTVSKYSSPLPVIEVQIPAVGRRWPATPRRPWSGGGCAGRARRP
jgi:hypothetical protein